MPSVRFSQLACISATLLNVTSAFVSPSINNYQTLQSNIIQSSTSLQASVDDDISRQLAKAKEILEKAKAKVAQDEAASKESNEKKKKEKAAKERDELIKSKNEETGLSTFDGDLMAALSEEEEWELKDMFDVFENELEESDVSKQLAERDVAASILNLRLSMKNEDYRKIFDNRNRFIGEDN